MQSYVAMLGLCLSLYAGSACAQCSSGSCAARPMSMPLLGPSEMLISSQMLAQPTSERELLAQGFTKRTDAQGRVVWSRRVSDADAVVTQRPCLDGSCGSGNLRRAISDWVAAPRKDSPSTGPAATSSPPEAEPTPAPRSTPLDYDKLAGLLADKLAADPRLRGPQGEPGLDGQDGKQGPAGPPGADAVVDYDQLAAAVVARLPPQRLQLVDDQGAILEEGRAPLGDPIKLKLKPIRKGP